MHLWASCKESYNTSLLLADFNHAASPDAAASETSFFATFPRPTNNIYDK